MTIGNFKYLYDMPVSIVRCDDLDTKHQGFVCILNKDTKVVDVFSIVRSVPYDDTTYQGSFIANELDISNDDDVRNQFCAFRNWINWRYKLSLCIVNDPEHGKVWIDCGSNNTFKTIDRPDHVPYSWKIAQAVK